MKKMSRRLLAALMMVTMLVALVPATGVAAEGVFGTVSLETKLDNDIVVYKNTFDSDTAFNALYNKDVEGGIHFVGAKGAVKHTYKSDYKPSGNGTATSTDNSKYLSPQIRVYSESKTKSRGFYVDLDHILEQYGSGAYTFSFSTTLQTHAGLIEASLNTLEDQTKLGNILWGTTTDGNHSEYVNFGGHVLVNHPTNSNSSQVYNKVFTSTTYIPEDAEHLRFFFGGSILDGGSVNVGGSADYKVAYFDDLVITKKANSYKDAALANGNIKLKSTVTPLNGIASATGRLLTAMYDADEKVLLGFDLSDEMTITAATVVDSTLAYPEDETKDYIIKTFFVDGFDNLAPYTLSYNPHESLMPNVSFEAPFTNDYRWMEGGNNIDTKPTYVYTGNRGIGRSISSGGTWIKIGEGKTATADGTVASPTAWANMIHNNGMGQYKVSFMARTRDNNANVKLQVRRHVQGSTKMDETIGKTQVDEQTSTANATVTTQWQKIEFVIDMYPHTYYKNNTATLSYRQNNYPFYLIATSVNGSDALYIDDFVVTKIAD